MVRRRDILFSVPAVALGLQGAVATDFDFSNFRGGTKESVSKYRGKAVALYFFNPG